MRKTLLFLVAAILLITESFAQATFNTGAISVTVSAYGRIRLFTPDGTRHLQRASILVGTGPTTVFDYENDANPLDPTVLVGSPAQSDYEIYGSYDNTYSNDLPDVIVKLNAYGWNNANYTIVKFRVLNDEVNQIQAMIGLDIIPEINQEYGFDAVSYNSALDVIRFHRGTQVNMGMKLLSTSLSSLYSFEWYDGYQVDADYWTWMNHGSLQPEYVSTTADGPVTITSQAPVGIAPGQYVNVYYAMALGANEAEMLANIAAAEAKYTGMVVSVEENELPSAKTTLHANFPNPFNASTTIGYQTIDNGFVSLLIYDALGSEVATLVNSEQTAGLHKVDFNAAGLAEGVYYYTLKADNLVKTNKMVITR